MLTYLFLTIVGFAAGVMNAVAGGGMLVVFPALIAVGLPPVVANATSNLAVIAGVFTSGAENYKNIRKLPRKYFLLIIPSAVGALLGAILLKNTSHTTFKHLAPYFILSAVILLAIEPFLNRHLQKRRKALARKHFNAMLICIGLLVLILAVYGGYFGAGFGIAILALLGLTSIKTIYQMNGMKNILGATALTVSLIYLAHNGLVNWHYGFLVLGGNVVGGFTGAYYAQRLPAATIRGIVITIGLIAAALIH